MTVRFHEAELGQDAWVYKCPPGHEYGWVADTEYFDDIDDPITVKRQRWMLAEEQTVTFHPSTELCNECGGDPDQYGGCGTCDGEGIHPLAGQMEVLS